MTHLILASASETRASMLRNAGVSIESSPARIDEEAVKQSLQQADAKPRDIADALAEAKARKVAGKHPNALVLGSDQVLDFGGVVLSKPRSAEDAVLQLKMMQGQHHSLLSAAVLFEDSRPVWRHVGQTRLGMRKVSDDYIDEYVARNWNSIKNSVGCYKLEEEGVRLFDRIEGDYFTVLGLPLLELLSYLTLRGTLPS